MKKILPFLSIAMLPLIAEAQDFEFAHDTAFLYTTGSDEGFLSVQNNIENISDDAWAYEWRMVNPDVELPEGWSYDGFCDNTTCYLAGSSVDPFTGITLESMEIPARDVSLFKLQINIPTTAEDGEVLFKFEVKSPNTTDTAIFVVNKSVLGIRAVSINDSRVNLYPNPSSHSIQLFTNRELKIENVQVYNILGQKVLEADIDNELTMLDISKLASGDYILKAYNNKNEAIAVRKFIKQ